MITTYVPNLLPALPEIILALSALVALVIGVFLKTHSARMAFAIAKISVLVALIFLTLNGFHKPLFTFNGQFVADYYSDLMRFCILCAVEIILWVISHSCKHDDLDAFEIPILILLSTMGALICVDANDLLILFIGIELMSLPTLVLIAMRKKDPLSAEAAIKYFTTAAIASALFLFGVSFIYGFVGNTSYDVIQNALGQSAMQKLNFIPVVGIFCILIALCLKAAAAPLHMWSPDVYQGAPLSIVLFFGSVPKLAIVAAMIRLTCVPFIDLSQFWGPLLTFIALASLIIGSYAALTQKNLLRLIAYASTANMGYVLIGISLGTELGAHTALFYIIFYILSTILLFSALLQISKDGHHLSNVSDLNGLFRLYPMTAFVLGFTFFSMAGIPPLPGFIVKLNIIYGAMSHQNILVPFFAVLTAVVSAGYYLQIMKAMFFNLPTSAKQASAAVKVEVSQKIILALLMLALVFLMLIPGHLISATKNASTILFHIV